MKAAVVDLFCGVGGLTHDLEKVGFNVVAGIDNDPTCSHAYNTNISAKFIEADVPKYPASEIQELFGYLPFTHVSLNPAKIKGAFFCNFQTNGINTFLYKCIIMI